MSKRLLTLRQIQAEKFPRSRTWIFTAISQQRFPKPIGGCVPNLWEEDAVDRFVESFVAAAKERADAGARRVAKASVARTQRRQEMASA